jgi:methylmalonyl-CoA mutase
VLNCGKTIVNGFDSVTLYGNDPHTRPDILWKKRVCCFDACFDECPTSVPAAPMGLFMNAIDQQCEYQRK